MQLDQKVSLPPGRVMVAVQPTVPGNGPTMLEVLDRIHRDQQAQGRTPMTEEEMAAEIAQMRAEEDESEERWRQIWSQTDARSKRRDKS